MDNYKMLRMQNIYLYNTLTKNLDEFIPITPNTVGIYSCGPTVYNYQHLGNMRAVIFADTLRRMFVCAGYTVKHVINITDVGHLTSDGDDGDDKMEKGATREGKSVWDIATFYTDDYFKCLDLLNIPREAYAFPRATETIPEQIDIVKTLEEKGYTYKISDGIYFDTSKFPQYADFAHLDIEGLQSGARIGENKEKKNITDFALWKFSPTDTTRQMEWDSPWGKGFPGWHIECSAMSKKILGPHFDIHTGGIDHIPVHHTNEIAQSECANEEKYVNYWMHLNFLNDAAGKMAKSNGEFLRLQSIIDKSVAPLAFRYYLLTVHYRSEIAFSFEALEASANAYAKLTNWCTEHTSIEGATNTEYLNKFNTALYNDLSTSTCIATMWNLIKDDTVLDTDKYATIMKMDEVLGLGLSTINSKVAENIQELIRIRDEARANKNWPESDSLRDQIEKEGYIVKDTESGTKVYKK
jgi:cysteinyl-tRNA synthetase